MKSPMPLLAGLALAGCYTELPVDLAPEPTPAAFAALQKGLPAAQVRSLLGDPAEIRSLRAALPSEVWVYHRKVAERDDSVPLGTREVPVTNPRTGQTEVTTEPVYETQTTTITETIELLMVEQRLIEWKTRRIAEPRIHLR